MQPPDYTFDADRLAALARYDILDTPAEPGFDDIVQLATLMCETPTALVSLVDSDRQWFKARICFELAQTGLDSSVCAHAMIEPGLLIIPDLTQDERTKHNPLVTGYPHIRFYAGAPFRVATGEVLGSLCVIDTEPRPGGLTAKQTTCLVSLARQVSSQLELRRAIAERDAFATLQLQAAARRNSLIHLGEALREMTTVADMTRAAAAIVGRTLRVSRAGFGLLTPDGSDVTVEPDWTADGVASIAGLHQLDDYGNLRDGLLRGEAVIIGDVALDPRTSGNTDALSGLGICSLVNMPVREHGRTVAIFIVHDQQPRDWSQEVVTFLRNVADRLEVGIARLKAEAQQEVLNQELGHRLKNTFAIIQAIATQTLRAVPDREPVDAFVQRLHALSAAHDVLLLKRWSAADLGDIVTGVVGALAEPERFDIAGPTVQIGPRATLSVSLLLHELTTNAIKYGALSNTTGRVRIEWHLIVNDEEPQLALHWHETGGPPAIKPARGGFGSKLIRVGLVGTGGVDLRYLKLGFEAEFRAPLAQVQLT